MCDALFPPLRAVSATVRVECFLPLPAALGLASVLLFRVVGLRSWAGSPSWSMSFGFPAVVRAATPIPTIASFCNIGTILGAHSKR